MGGIDDIKKNILVGKIKGLLTNIIRKEQKKQGASTLKMVFIRKSKDIQIVLVSNKDTIVVEKLSKFVNPLEVMAYKTAGFDIDKDVQKYIERFFVNYCNDNKLNDDVKFFTIEIYNEDIGVMYCGISGNKAINVDDIISYGSREID